MDRRRLVLYLLLNVFVSACVTGAILYWYDQNYRGALAPAIPVVQGSSQLQEQPAAAHAATYPPDEQIPVEIVSVVGAGTLQAEMVVVRYNGDGDLGLIGWQLRDENNNVYTFPLLTLFPNGAVQVHTASGSDTVVDLYMGLPDPIWQSGEVASLYDPQGNLRAIYRVP